MTAIVKPPAPAKGRAKTKPRAEPKPRDGRGAERSGKRGAAQAALATAQASLAPATSPQPGALPPEEWPDLTHIVTEDDTPVDNIFSEKQQRLLTEPLYASWPGPGDGRPFLALANVGLFFGINEPPLVPDAMLSVDVRAPNDLWPKANRSYFVWVYGKPPDVVVEVVSNREGGEGDRKLITYARIGIHYYAIYDPERHIGRQVLRLYRLRGGVYESIQPSVIPGVGLSLSLWTGSYEGTDATWLRWHDADGKVVPTGAERAEAEHARAEAEHARAEAERERAEAERERAERLEERLRAMGVDPEV